MLPRWKGDSRARRQEGALEGPGIASGREAAGGAQGGDWGGAEGEGESVGGCRGRGARRRLDRHIDNSHRDRRGSDADRRRGENRGSTRGDGAEGNAADIGEVRAGEGEDRPAVAPA